MPEKLAAAVGIYPNQQEIINVSDEIELRDAVDAGGVVVLHSNITLTDTLRVAHDVALFADSTIQDNGLPSRCVLRRGATAGDMIQVADGAKLTLHHITLDGESSTDGGATISVEDGSTLEVLDNTQLVNSHDNLSAMDSPAIRNGGVCMIDDGVFLNNHSDKGGAIENTAAGSLTILNALFRANGSANEGGAIYNAGQCVIEGGSFRENHAGTDGGAIYNADDGTLELRESKRKIAFYKNSAEDYGGAIFIAKLTRPLAIPGNCSFIFNRARSKGAIYVPSDELMRLVTSPLALFANNSDLDTRAIIPFNLTATKTADAPYLPEEFTYALYDPDWNEIGTTVVDENGNIDIPPFGVDDTWPDGEYEFRLVEQLPACGHWQADYNTIRITFTITGGVLTGPVFDNPLVFNNRFVYPVRCCEPESHCPWECAPPDLMCNESIFLPVMRKWIF
ncbi:hypothetical protein AGMMS49992_20720 [Clostridia bacterium]|nr:hypothetical protein AGMMS49992_20720 [Clostridia bacterium]